MAAAAAALVVLVAVLAVHAPVVGFDFVNWDDDLHVLKNPSVLTPGDVPLSRHLLTPYLGYPVPVTVGTYVAEHSLAGTEPWAFHLTSLLIHAAAALALLLALLRLGCGPAAATLGALLFALHPATAEPVSWISGRKDVLSGMLAIASVAAFLGIAKDDQRMRARVHALVLILLASLSKPSVVLVPVLFLALDARRGRAAWLWAGALAFEAALVVAAFVLEERVGALGAGGGLLAAGERVLAGAGWHARILAWPFDLMPKYLDPPAGVEASTLIVGGVATAAATALTVVAWFRGHPARVGLALALLAYAPQSGVVPLVRQYADCYLYVPIAGLAMAAAACATSLRAATGPVVARASAAGLAVLAVALGLATRDHEALYADGVTLWSEVYRAYPDSPQVCRNLGNAYLHGRRDEPESAIRVYRHCIRTLGHREFFVRNLAIATARAGRADEAAALMEEASRSRQAAPRDTLDDDGR
jgi:hypothetical protein